MILFKPLAELCSEFLGFQIVAQQKGDEYDVSLVLISNSMVQLPIEKTNIREYTAVERSILGNSPGMKLILHQYRNSKERTSDRRIAAWALTTCAQTFFAAYRGPTDGVWQKKFLELYGEETSHALNLKLDCDSMTKAFVCLLIECGSN